MSSSPLSQLRCTVFLLNVEQTLAQTRNEHLPRAHADAVSFPVAFRYGKTPPGKPSGPEAFRCLLLFLVAEFPVLGWNRSEARRSCPVSPRRGRLPREASSSVTRLCVLPPR